MKTPKKFLETGWLPHGGIPQANYIILTSTRHGCVVGREGEFCLEGGGSCLSLLLRWTFQRKICLFFLYIPQLRYVVFPVIAGDNRFTIGCNCPKFTLCIQKMDRQLVSYADIPILQLNAAPIWGKMHTCERGTRFRKDESQGIPKVS